MQAWQLWQRPVQWRKCDARSVRHVESHFAMSAPESVERLYKRELGGGALLDIGVYPLSFIQVQLARLDCGSCQYLAALPTLHIGSTCPVFWHIRDAPAASQEAAPSTVWRMHTVRMSIQSGKPLHCTHCPATVVCRQASPHRQDSFDACLIWANAILRLVCFVFTWLQ
jgi:hypothetical protein